MSARQVLDDVRDAIERSPGTVLVSAGEMGLAARSDPSMRPPTFPRLASGLEWIAFEAGLIVVNGPQRVVFRGRAAHALLPRLLDAMDGHRTVDEVAEIVGTERAVVADAVALLYSRGVIEDRAQPADDEMATWLGRLVDSVRAHRSGRDAADALRTARVRVDGDADHVGPLVAALVGCGVDARSDGDGDLVIAVCGDRDDGRWRAWDERYHEQRGPWLPVLIERDAATIGPLVLPGETTCRPCAWMGLPEPERGEPNVSFSLMWPEVVTAEVVALVARAFPPAGGGARLRVASDLSVTQDHPARNRTCARCVPTPDRDAVEAAWKYEDAVRLPPAAVMIPKMHQAHYAVKNIRLAGQPLDVEGDALALPWVEPERVDDADPLRTLAALLRTSFGVRAVRARVQRSAPTGGNLGSPHAMVWIRTPLADLPAGIYAYEPMNHTLVSLREMDLAELEQDPELAVPAPIVLFQLGSWGRVREKYGAFAFKVVNIDAGVAAGYLDVVARSLNLEVRRIGPSRERRMIEQLGLDWGSVVLTDVYAIGGGAWGRR